MELLFEFIFDLIFEGSVEVAKSRKVSKWIRYPIIAILSLFMLLVIIVIGFVGIAMILSKESYSTYIGLIFIVFDIILIISGTKKIIKELKLRKTDVIE